MCARSIMITHQRSRKTFVPDISWFLFMFSLQPTLFPDKYNKGKYKQLFNLHSGAIHEPRRSFPEIRFVASCRSMIYDHRHQTVERNPTGSGREMRNNRQNTKQMVSTVRTLTCLSMWNRESLGVKVNVRRA